MEVSDPNGAGPVRSGGREAATETHAGEDGGGGGGGDDYVCVMMVASRKGQKESNYVRKSMMMMTLLMTMGALMMDDGGRLSAPDQGQLIISPFPTSLLIRSRRQ